MANLIKKDIQKIFNYYEPTLPKSLSRINKLLKLLGKPHFRLEKIIHIAGTNGKGSVLTFLKSCLFHNNLTVNALISPHLLRINERIVIKNNFVKDKTLIDALNRCDNQLNRNEITFFEVITACGFDLFSQFPADWNILEVGLGGRYDSTNVIPKKNVAVITPISFDHENYLGEDILSIAKEKFGIVNKATPVVIGKQKKEIVEYISKNKIFKKNKIFMYDKHWVVKESQGKFIYEDEKDSIEIRAPHMIGSHQIMNAGLSIATLRFLKKNNDLRIEDQIIKKGIMNAKLLGRLEILKGRISKKLNNSEIWIDGCHNPSGANAIAKTMKSINRKDTKKMILIFGLAHEKKIKEFMEPFKGMFDATIYVPLQNRKYVRPEEIIKNGKELELDIIFEPSLQEGLNSIDKSQDLRVLICGSLSLVAEAKKIN